MHRPLMVLTTVLSIIGFFVILSDLNWKWVSQVNKVNFAHSIFGIFAISLSIIQVEFIFILSYFFQLYLMILNLDTNCDGETRS
jgi:hypothetical protein